MTENAPGHMVRGVLCLYRRTLSADLQAPEADAGQALMLIFFIIPGARMSVPKREKPGNPG